MIPQFCCLHRNVKGKREEGGKRGAGGNGGEYMITLLQELSFVVMLTFLSSSAGSAPNPTLFVLKGPFSYTAMS